ncbi:MAG TPA: hypothetical protein VK747_19440, partial [Blastocatellia bacterium]|nr:hypothetical protein [Blastocatellia bacterium]
LSETGCDILTVGQYLAPTPRHIPIEKYYSPDEFAGLREKALKMGFRYVEAGPLVRSSYHAGRHTRGLESSDYSSDPIFEAGWKPNAAPSSLIPLVRINGRSKTD